MIYDNAGVSMLQDHGDTPAIAIVDDDDAVRSAIQLLAVSLGWDAHPYDSAQAFLAGLSKTRIDCLILDLQMPGTTGAELLETLEKQHIEVPVVVITALRDDPLVARIRARDEVAVLTKPFRDETLVSVVDNLLKTH